jgi:hypothetical protein
VGAGLQKPGIRSKGNQQLDELGVALAAVMPPNEITRTAIVLEIIVVFP